jgi:hypothetical protein
MDLTCFPERTLTGRPLTGIRSERALAEEPRDERSERIPLDPTDVAARLGRTVGR